MRQCLFPGSFKRRAGCVMRYPLSMSAFRLRLMDSNSGNVDDVIGPPICSALLHGPSAITSSLLESSKSSTSSQLPPYESHLVSYAHHYLIPSIEGDIDGLQHVLSCVLSCNSGNHEEVAEGSVPHGIVTTVRRITLALESSFLTSSSAGMDGSVLPHSALASRAVQCRLLALCYLLSHEMNDAQQLTSGGFGSLQALFDTLSAPLPANVLCPALALAPPHVCHALLTFQHRAVDFHLQQLSSDDLRSLLAADPFLVLSRCIGTHKVAPLWRAILDNDHFFSSAARGRGESMHTVLMMLLEYVPAGSVTQLTQPHCAKLRDMDWAALLNKTSRVYLNKKRGQELLAVHRLLLSKFPGISLRMPHAYMQRLVGAVYDEALLSVRQYASPEGPADTWGDVIGLLRWMFPLVSQVAHVHRAVLSIGRKAAVQLPSCTCEGDPVLSEASVTAQRLLVLYDVATDQRIGSFVASDKDAFQQLTRYTTSALFDELSAMIQFCDEGRERVGPSIPPTLDRWLSFIAKDTSIKFTWVLNAVLTLLQCVRDACTPGSDASIIRGQGLASIGVHVASHVLNMVETMLLPARNAVGIKPRSIPGIRRVLEALHVELPSPFWWMCGCGAECPACSTHCYSCMRRGRVAWQCASCHVEHPAVDISPRSSASSTSLPACRTCGADHPRLAAAHRAFFEICSTCKSAFDATLGDCAACSGEQPADQQRASDCTCQSCGHPMPFHTPLCPRCFARNPLSDVTLWHCHTCHNYSYSTWSKCQRCAPHVVSVKSAGALTVPFFTWKCACGAVQHPCKLTCSSCSRSPSAAKHASGPSFQCTQCNKQSNLRKHIHWHVPSLNRATAVPLRITVCQHCAFPHPRDQVLLALPKAVPRLCVSCGHSYVARQGSGLGPQVCASCCSLQPINTNMPFLCPSPQCLQKADGPHWQWGMECSSCSTLRTDVQRYSDPFVWKCLASSPSHADQSEGSAAPCNHWTPSWEARCGACGSPRPHAPDEEIRAKYIPWTCDQCNVPQRATTVLVCSNCGDGAQPPPDEPCASCGLPHIAYRCPTMDQLLEAERVLSEMETMRGRQRYGEVSEW